MQVMKPASVSPKPKPVLPITPRHSPPVVLGVDGGGTRTRAALVDARNHVLGEGESGPSNPLRVGVAGAAAAVREATEQACEAAGVRRTEIAAAQVGLAGVRRLDLRARVREALMAALNLSALEVATDADIALYGATGGAPGLVVIAGTGSICCGLNGKGRRACAGGWGPLAGDEGSGSWMARRGLQAVARATDGRDDLTALAEAACAYFNVAAPDDLSTAIYAANMTNDRLAGFARHVVEAAKARDAAARIIVADAGRELGAAASAVVRKLKMEQDRFQVAYVGGVFHAGELILAPLRDTLARVAHEASLTTPLLAPTLAAAQMARAQARRLALAG